MGKTEADLKSRLEKAFQPAYLEVENESRKHNVPPGSESHFRLVIVSEKFSGMSQVNRHREVYSALGDLMKVAIHALAFQTFTGQEWEKRAAALKSPPCLGGSSSDK